MVANVLMMELVVTGIQQGCRFMKFTQPDNGPGHNIVFYMIDQTQKPVETAKKNQPK